MPLSMNELGDFMRLGPQTHPRSAGGAQVITRGPHGMRLAADPVRTRAGKARGSGFRFWTELERIPPDTRWQPKQEVVELLGLGSLPPGAGNPNLDAARSAFRSVGEQAAMCKVAAASKALSFGRAQVNLITNPSLRAVGEAEFSQAAALLASVSGRSEEDCRAGRNRFDARVREAQGAAAAEDERQRREGQTCSITNLQPCFDKVGQGMTKIAAVGTFVVLGAVFLYGFGGGLGSSLGSRKKD